MNVKQMVMNMLGNSNPIFANLVGMAEKGNSKGIEEFARNYCKEHGRDFDTEFAQFQNMFMNKR